MTLGRPTVAQSAGPLPARLRAALRDASATAIATLLEPGAGATGAPSSSASWPSCVALVRSGPVPRAEFLPGGRCRRDQPARARAGRHAHRGDRGAVRPRRADDPRRSFRPTSSTSIVDNIGLPVSGINRAYSNTGGVGPQDGDILVTLNEEPPPDRRLRARQLRTALARAVSRRRPSPFCRPTSSARS